MTTGEVPEHPHDPAFRCATWTKAHDVDPVGSSPEFDSLVLVECPLPWPHDADEIPLLAGRTAPGTRVMAVVPEPHGGDRDDEDGDPRLRIVHHRRVRTNHLEGVDHLVTAADAPALLDALLADPQADSRGLPSAVGEAPPEVLVCAHGRRDPCCGRWGTLLHLELSALWSDVRLWRCSHSGGHRFAPTVTTLPDGRAWAWVEPPLVDEVVRRRGDVDAVAPFDRGSSALDPWCQAVEREVFRRQGWGWLDVGLTEARSSVAADGRTAEVVLTWPTGTARATVEVRREVPVLTCGAPPEQAKKSSRELGVRDLDVGPVAVPVAGA